MAGRWNSDPVQAAHDVWTGNGWEDTADGVAAVTALLRVQKMLTQRADQVLAPLELTFARYEVLIVLYFNEDGVGLAALAKALQLHQASITNLVDKLEKQRLLERRPHPSDRRVTLARITGPGRGRTRTAIGQLNAELYGRLGLTPEEIRALVSIFAKVRHAWGDGANNDVLAKGEADAAGTLLHVAQPSA